MIRTCPRSATSQRRKTTILRPEERIPQRRVPPDRLPALGAFADIQRQLAAIEFPAVRAAQRAIEQSAVFRLPEVWAAQDLVAKHFAQSIDFSHLTHAYKAISDAAAISGAVATQKQWADSLAKSIHFPALENALASSAALAAFTENNAALLKSIQDQSDLFARITEGINLKLPTIDVARWLEALDRWINGGHHARDFHHGHYTDRDLLRGGCRALHPVRNRLQASRRSGTPRRTRSGRRLLPAHVERARRHLSTDPRKHSRVARR